MKLGSYFDNFRNFVLVFSLSSILLISSLGFQESNAYEITFDYWGSPLKDNPVICAIKPSAENLADWQVERFMKQSKISSDEWESKLKQNQRNSDVWEITFIEKSHTDDISDCDISIQFLPKAEDERFEHGLLGIAQYNPIDDNYQIKIYYLLGKLCYNSEKVGDTIWYWYDPCFTDDIRISEDLNITISHELGHAFGLGHYAADDDGVNAQWSKGYAPAPSIMVKFHLEQFGNQQIRDADIKKIRELYGEKGFQAFIGDETFDLFRAQVFLENKYLDELISYSEKTLRKDPNNEYALTYKGLALWEYDKYDKSIVEMDKVLKTNPENLDALYTKSKWLNKSDRFDEGLELINKVIAINPEHYKALSYKGLILENMERYEEADKSYKKSFETNPFYDINLKRWGDLRSDFGQYEDAVKLYKGALEINPRYESALLHLGNALFDLEQYEDALGFYNKVLAIDPDDANALYNKALVFEELGREDEAKVLYAKVESIQRQNVETAPIIEESTPALEIESDNTMNIPDWIRNNAKWWVDGSINDQAFVNGIQFLIKEGVIQIPETEKSSSINSQEIPSWIKSNADWWSQGLISDDDFVKGIQFMVEKGIIVV